MSNNIGLDGNTKDRSLGEYWEDVFIEMAKSNGWEAWPFSRMRRGYFHDSDGNRYTSPDVWILKREEKQYTCEIKHKKPAKNGCYGFELKREESMLRIEQNYSNQFGEVVALYVVHDHDKAGGKWNRVNDFSHWVARELLYLSQSGHEGMPQKTYYNGKVTNKKVRMKYYKTVDFFNILHYLKP